MLMCRCSIAELSGPCPHSSLCDACIDSTRKLRMGTCNYPREGLELHHLQCQLKTLLPGLSPCGSCITQTSCSCSCPSSGSTWQGHEQHTCHHCWTPGMQLLTCSYETLLLRSPARVDTHLEGLGKALAGATPGEGAHEHHQSILVICQHGIQVSRPEDLADLAREAIPDALQTAISCSGSNQAATAACLWPDHC